MDQFVKDVKPSRFTDITGGLLQAVEYLNEKGTGRKTILIYSDLKEETLAKFKLLWGGRATEADA